MLREDCLKFSNAYLFRNDGKKEDIRLKLTKEFLIFEREKSLPIAGYSSLTSKNDLFNQVRHVKVTRDENGSLGLSIKGGIEHGLPVLVCKINNIEAHKLDQIMVGDAIVEINGENVEMYSHKKVVSILKNAGQEVNFKVQLYQPDLQYYTLQRGCSQSRYQYSRSNLQEDLLLHNRWQIYLKIDLLFVCIAIKKDQSSNDFNILQIEEINNNNYSKTRVQFMDSRLCSEWYQDLRKETMKLNKIKIFSLNKTLPESEKIYYMGWMKEKGEYKRPSRQMFITLKGSNIHLHEYSPIPFNINWESHGTTFKIYECFEQFQKGKILLLRQIDFSYSLKIFQIVSSKEFYDFKKAWYLCSYFGTKPLQKIEFECEFKKNQKCKLIVNISESILILQTYSNVVEWEHAFAYISSIAYDKCEKNEKSFYIINLAFGKDLKKLQFSNKNSALKLICLLKSVGTLKILAKDPTFILLDDI